MFNIKRCPSCDSNDYTHGDTCPRCGYINPYVNDTTIPEFDRMLFEIETTAIAPIYNRQTMKTCPYCAEQIKVEATICRYCKSKLKR